jgi:hypothetical protein
VTAGSFSSGSAAAHKSVTHCPRIGLVDLNASARPTSVTGCSESECRPAARVGGIESLAMIPGTAIPPTLAAGRIQKIFGRAIQTEWVDAEPRVHERHEGRTHQDWNHCFAVGFGTRNGGGRWPIAVDAGGDGSGPDMTLG